MSNNTFSFDSGMSNIQHNHIHLRTLFTDFEHVLCLNPLLSILYLYYNPVLKCQVIAEDIAK